MSVGAVILGTILWIALLILASAAAWPVPAHAATRRRNMPLRHGLFLAGVLGALLVWRSPMLLLHRQLNLDEGQFLAQAITYTLDPVPWRSSNGGSAGPVDSYPLMWPYLLGLQPSYMSGRLTGLACVMVTVGFFLKTARLLVGDRFAMLAVLPMAAFFVFAFQSDFVHFSSEHVPMALLAVATYYLVAGSLRPSPGRFFVLGLVLGATMFAKLQAAPIAAYLAGAAAVLLLFRKGIRPRFGEIKGPLAALIAGTLVMPVLLLGPVIITGSWKLFVRDYLVFGVTYNRAMIVGNAAGSAAASTAGSSATAPASSSHLGKLLIFLGHGGEAMIYFFLVAFFAVTAAVWIVRAKKRPPLRWFAALALILGYVGVAALVIIKPHTHFHHYLFLAVGSVMLLALWLARRVLPRNLCTTTPPFSPALLPAYALFVSAPFILWHFIDPFRENADHYFYYRLPPITDNAVIGYINAHKHPGDSLAVWGWVPEYYVETHLPSATPDVVGGEYELPGKDADAYRLTYLDFLDRHKPRFFVDAVGVYYWPSWPQPIERCRATAYPTVADYLARHYDLAATIAPGPINGYLPVLVYMRRD